MRRPFLHSLTASTAVGVSLAALYVGTVLSIMSSPAWPHDALPTAAMPEGWSYSYSCCAQNDCRSVPDGAISETPQGYVINRTGEVIAYTDKRIKDSPDGLFHWCSVAGAEDSRTICLYRAPRGY